MLIAFDGAGLAGGPITGVGRAFLTGLQAYAELGGAECVLLLPAGVEAPALRAVRIEPAPRGAWARQRHLPRLLRALRASLLHGSVASVPLRAPCPTIATVHDLPWLHPELGERTSWWRTFATVRALRSARAIVAPSTRTAQDTQQLLGRKSPPIHVIPHATPLPLTAAPHARRGPLLVLGDDRPRKNRLRLQAAHALARTRAPELPPLAFVGPTGGERGTYVDEGHKHELLRTCRALVHVSRFEGFGLPVLEGLAHGAPVLCSALPPHREIAGDAALFVDPDDTEAIAAGLLRIDGDEALRARLQQAGPARAAAFAPTALAARWRALHTTVLA
ncbi:MAG: glycosyltransferase family 4 protein [Planctomycetes bacterium]|jgi:glycosyltransferase involved in cell wall biosynthesis|nr:glycosyltransferase family 4 protein [Planctomycetota bacterium]